MATERLNEKQERSLLAAILVGAAIAGLIAAAIWPRECRADELRAAAIQSQVYADLAEGRAAFEKDHPAPRADIVVMTAQTWARVAAVINLQGEVIRRQGTVIELLRRRKTKECF